MITYKRDCWPDEDRPTELYLHIYIEGEDIDSGRIVIFEDEIHFDMDFTLKTSEEINQWSKIVKRAWQIKKEQDKKGWGKR